MDKIYFNEVNPEFKALLDQMEIPLKRKNSKGEAEVPRWMIPLSEVKSRGMYPDVFLAVENPYSVDGELDELEQDTFVRFFKKVQGERDFKEAFEEFKSITAPINFAWFNKYNRRFAPSSEDKRSVHIQKMAACIEATTQQNFTELLAGSGLTIIAGGQGGFDGIHKHPFLAPHHGLLTQCGYDPERPDLYKNHFLPTDQLPPVLQERAKGTVVLVFRYLSGAVGSGSAVYLGNGYFLTAYHNFYGKPNDPQELEVVGVFLGNSDEPFADKIDYPNNVYVFFEDQQRDLLLFRLWKGEHPSLSSVPLMDEGDELKPGMLTYFVGTPRMNISESGGGREVASVGEMTSVDDETIETSNVMGPGGSGGGLFTNEGRLGGIAVLVGARGLLSNENDDLFGALTGESLPNMGKGFVVIDGDEEYKYVFARIPPKVYSILRETEKE